MTRDLLHRIACIWIICLVLVSLQPYRPLGNGQSPSLTHRVEHLIAFGTTGLMLLALGNGRRNGWATALGVLCLALGIETAQLLIYRGAFEWWDVRDDMIALAIAAVLNRWTAISGLLLRENQAK